MAGLNSSRVLRQYLVYGYVRHLPWLRQFCCVVSLGCLIASGYLVATTAVTVMAAFKLALLAFGLLMHFLIAATSTSYARMQDAGYLHLLRGLKTFPAHRNALAKIYWYCHKAEVPVDIVNEAHKILQHDSDYVLALADQIYDESWDPGALDLTLLGLRLRLLLQFDVPNQSTSVFDTSGVALRFANLFIANKQQLEVMQYILEVIEPLTHRANFRDTYIPAVFVHRDPAAVRQVLERLADLGLLKQEMADAEEKIEGQPLGDLLFPEATTEGGRVDIEPDVKGGWDPASAIAAIFTRFDDDQVGEAAEGSVEDELQRVSDLSLLGRILQDLFSSKEQAEVNYGYAETLFACYQGQEGYRQSRQLLQALYLFTVVFKDKAAPVTAQPWQTSDNSAISAELRGDIMRWLQSNHELLLNMAVIFACIPKIAREYYQTWQSHSVDKLAALAITLQNSVGQAEAFTADGINSLLTQYSASELSRVTISREKPTAGNGLTSKGDLFFSVSLAGEEVPEPPSAGAASVGSPASVASVSLAFQRLALLGNGGSRDRSEDESSSSEEREAKPLVKP